MRCCLCGKDEGHGYYVPCRGGYRSWGGAYCGGRETRDEDVNAIGAVPVLCPTCYRGVGLCLVCQAVTYPAARIEGVAERKLDVVDGFDQAIRWGSPE